MHVRFEVAVEYLSVMSRHYLRRGWDIRIWDIQSTLELKTEVAKCPEEKLKSSED